MRRDIPLTPSGGDGRNVRWIREDANYLLQEARGTRNSLHPDSTPPAALTTSWPAISPAPERLNVPIIIVITGRSHAIALRKSLSAVSFSRWVFAGRNGFEHQTYTQLHFAGN